MGIAPGTKVLFANFPADGHFNPLTGLAAYLKAAGCDVRWYTSTHYAKKIAALDIPFFPLRKAVDVNAAVDLEEIFPERKKIKGQVAKLKFDMKHVFILRGPEFYSDIEDIHREFPFQVMVSDITFGGIPFVRECMEIPVIAINVMPLMENSKDLPPSGLGLVPSQSWLGRRKQDVMRYLANRILFAEPTQLAHKILRSYGIDPEGAGIFELHIRKANVVLQSGTPGFEYKRSDISPNIHFAGPLLPFDKGNKEQWHDRRLLQYKKVILVTQGTVEKDINKLLVPAIEAFRKSDHLLVVTTGGSQTQELRDCYEAENVIIEDFIPFRDVMPYADVYVSNGGYGGVLLGVQNGVPMVVAGVHEGKNEINARIGYFKLGINLKTETPKPESLKKAVETVLEDDVYKANVVKLMEEFDRYDPNLVLARQLAALLPVPAPRKAAAVASEAFVY